MSTQKIYHSISSSDDEEDYEGIDVTEQKSTGGVVSVKTDTLKDILSKVKGVKYDFGEVARSSINSILYSNEINEEDEIWLLQTPKEVKLDSLRETDLKLGNSTQTILKARKKERRYNAHTVECASEEVSCVLPSVKTQSFSMNVYPIMGRIILQEDVQIDRKDKDSDETLTNSSILLESSVNSCAISQASDAEVEAKPLKKKKKKSLKQDSILNQ